MGMASRGSRWSISISPPAHIATAPPMAPSERFISPAERAIICPKAIVICTAAKRSSVNMLKSLVKPVAKMANQTQKPMVTASSPSLGELRLRMSRISVRYGLAAVESSSAARRVTTRVMAAPRGALVGGRQAALPL